MGDYAYYFLTRKPGTTTILERIDVPEWPELLYTLNPMYGDGDQPLGFSREEVLNPAEVEMLDRVTMDASAISVSEGYEPYKEPVFAPGVDWHTIFFKIAARHTGSNDESHFDNRLWSQTLSPLKTAVDDGLEVAVTVGDY